MLPRQPHAREGSCMNEIDPIYLGNVQSLCKWWRTRDGLSPPRSGEE